MTTGIPAPPEHPQLDERRIAQLRTHLAGELRRGRPWFGVRRAPRLGSAAAAALLLLVLMGAGYAVGNRALSAFDFWSAPSDPKRIGERVEVAAADEWSLQAWSSTRGICIGVVLDGAPAYSGCGMPVVGAPPDTVFAQPEPTHVIGYMAGGGDGDALYVTGPISESVARVQVELIDGRLLDAAVYEAPTELDTKLDFYFLRDEPSRDKTFERHPVKSLRAYDASGVLLERLDVPTR